MSDRQVGIALACGLFCVWPLLMLALGWWLRGVLGNWHWPGEASRPERDL